MLGNEKNRIAALNQSADIYVINRENVSWLVNRYFKKNLSNNFKNFPFDMIVIDESSSFKNPQAKRFKAMRIARIYTERIVELTGIDR